MEVSNLMSCSMNCNCIYLINFYFINCTLKNLRCNEQSNNNPLQCQPGGDVYIKYFTMAYIRGVFRRITNQRNTKLLQFTVWS